MDDKTPKTYRLSPEALELLEQLRKKLGVSRTAIIEMAIRMLAEREGVR